METSSKMYTPLLNRIQINNMDHMRILGNEPSSVILIANQNSLKKV